MGRTTRATLTISEELHQAVSRIDRPGAYWASGHVPPVLPGLEVDGLGPVGLPLSATQARELIGRCEQAPYGKGEETLVDPGVRRVWRLTPDKFSLTNPDWAETVRGVVGLVQAELGLKDQKLEAHLYDLLLYEEGGFFLPHRDGEKLDRMVATLVLVLPSVFAGGELVVRHEGEQQVIETKLILVDQIEPLISEIRSQEGRPVIWPRCTGSAPRAYGQLYEN